MRSRLADWWRRASRRRRLLSVIGLAVAVVAAWIGQGVLSVLAQIEPYADYWEARAGEPGSLRYAALGDSAAQSIGATDPSRGYVALLADRIEAETGEQVHVLNLAVAGARVADVLDEQVPQLASIDPPPDVVTVAVGGNDAGRTEPEAFRTAFAAVLDALPAGAVVADLPDFQGGPRLEASRALSQIARQEIGARPHLHLAQLEESTSANRWRDYAPDFFHPDDSGYERWAEAFWRPVAAVLEGG